MPENLFDEIYRHRSRIDSFDEVILAPEIAELRCNGFVASEDLEFYEDQLGRLRPAGAPSFLLDLGCGRGGLGMRLARRLDLGLVGVDISMQALTLARQDQAQASEPSEARWVCADFESIAEETGAFGAVISVDSLHFASHPDRALAEAARLCAKGAPFILTVCTKALDEGEHWTRRLQNADFSVLAVDDVSAVWRDALRTKHEHRCLRANVLERWLGVEEARRVLEVSRSLLGVGGTSPLLMDRWRFRFSTVRN